MHRETVNQEERRPKRARNSSPETVTSDLLPSRTSVHTRPFHSPLPSRRVTRIRFSVPTLGYARSTARALSDSVQACTGLPS